MNVDVQRDNCGSIDIGFYKQRAAQLRREAILELANDKQAGLSADPGLVLSTACGHAQRVVSP
jgi:hypothetical protein